MIEFVFNDLGITDEQLTKARESMDNRGPRFFEPGNYDLEIVGVKFSKDNQWCPSWKDFEFEFGEVGGRKIKHWISVPTNNLKIEHPDVKNPLLALVKFERFLNALGENMTLDAAKLGKLMKRLFGKVEGLIGKPINITVGYTGKHLAYLGKSEAGANQYQIQLPDGKPVVPTIFADRKEAEAKAAQMSMQLQGFAKVTKFHPPEGFTPIFAVKTVDEVKPEEESW